MTNLKKRLVDEEKYPAKYTPRVSDWRTEVGRSSVELHCACGWTRRVYIWSWAGHGKVFCKVCNRQHNYLELMGGRA
jgi:hypothetical protein